MIPVEEFKKYLEEYDLTDQEVSELRDAWYHIINEIINDKIGDQYEKEKNEY